jgi:crotonobetainyl-CoA:carnitine CoA-transferase CaiB-like acyl-CoA transferase
VAIGALAGIQVIELGDGVSAPYCGKLFADYGADVVKVESPEGDLARRWGPFQGDVPHPEKSGLFHFLNTNKRSMVIDLDQAAGRERFLEWIARADVLIENQSLARLRAIGLTHEGLSKHNPDLVIVSISPFGRTGPYAEWKGYDLNAYHLSGASSRYCGRPAEPPLEHGTYTAEFFGAVAGASWGLAAVLGRDRAGGGQLVDVSCAEVVAATFGGAQNVGGYAQNGVYDKRTGVGMPFCAPATIMPCRDGHVWMLTIEPGQWHGLVKVMGNPEWAQPEIFNDMFIRAENQDLIYPMVGAWAAERTKMEIQERCQAAGCPITAVLTIEEAALHPHLSARGYLVELDHPELGKLLTLGAPFKLSATPGGPSRPAPRLGEHSAELPHTSSERRPTRRATGTAGRPLEGVRVANFGWVWAGPVTGQTLSFLGAEVYKIESRARIDMMRTLPPFGGSAESDPNRSIPNHSCWAGNGSVSLNLKKPAALELARQLVAKCDVVVENFGPGVMQKFGLGYDDLRVIKPDLVMFCMPAAGLDGPLKDIRTYGLSLTSTTGLDSMTGYRDGDVVPVENAFADPFNGVFGAFAILAALAHRERTGEGQLIDFSQQEAVMQMVGPAFADYTMNGRVAGPIGNRHPCGAAAPHGVFPCAGDDRWITIAVASDSEWQGLVSAMGDPEWAKGEVYTTLAGRLAHQDAIDAQLAAFSAAYDDCKLAATLQAHGVAAAPVLSIADLLENPQSRARETFIEVDHPSGYPTTIYGSYVKLGRSPVEVRPGPIIGQDNEHVFRELLGLDRTRYQQLVDDAVIY